MKVPGIRDHLYFVFVLGVGQVASWGVLYYSFAVCLTPMRTELGFTTTELTSAFSAALGISALVGVWVGRWLDRHSPRPLMTAGSVVAVLMVLAWSRVDSLASLYAVFAGIGAAMGAVLYEPAFVVIAKSFPTRHLQAVTALTLIGASASLVFSPLSSYLISNVGWRETLVVLALVLAATTIPIHALCLRRPSVVSPPIAAGPRRRMRPHKATQPGFLPLTVAFVLGSLVSSSIAVLLVGILVSRGHGLEFGAWAAGLVGAGQIPGRLMFAIAGARIGIGDLTTACFALMTTALILLAIGDAPWVVIAFATLFGMGAGMASPLRAALVAELYGYARFGRNSGVVAMFVTAARAAAPVTAGAVLVLGTTKLVWAFVVITTLAAVTAHRAVRRGRPSTQDDPLTLQPDAPSVRSPRRP